MFVARMGMWGMMWGGGRSRRKGNGAAMLLRMLAIILAPIAAMLIRMAISRTREYHADDTAAEIARDSEGLARALEKMEGMARNRQMQVNEAASHMFIINPLSAKGMSGLFSTHPPIRERVRKLRNRY